MTTALVTGGSSGLGELICSKLSKLEGWWVWNWSRETGVDISHPLSLAVATKDLPFKQVDILVNCAGVNLIDYLPNVDEEDWDLVMNTNAKAIYLVVQKLLPRLQGGTILNIVSNAAHMPMTASLAYNSSKAAALMMTKQMARELGKTHNITVFSVSPNKLAGTKMSKYIESRTLQVRGWTVEQAKNYQLAALPAGEETPPDVLAEFICFLLANKERHKYLQGCDIPYGGP